MLVYSVSSVLLPKVNNLFLLEANILLTTMCKINATGKEYKRLGRNQLVAVSET